MCETYTINGDSLFRVTWTRRAAQTFRPVTTHILSYIDIGVKFSSYYPFPSISVYNAGVDHKPYGAPLVSSLGVTYPPEVIDSAKRVRFLMGPVTLYEGEYYCFVMRGPSSFLPADSYLLYDADDATYPRGVRLSSTDSGATWSVHPSDDIIFAEFGNPPAPAPPPNPPIINFTVMDVQQFLTPTGIKFVVTTNVPVHLYMYWTSTEPLTHPTTAIVRGVSVPDHSRYCFVEWHKNEQAEEGDTLYHTFVKEPWAFCETRWFVYRGTIDGDWSPSISAIFKKHRVFQPWIILVDERWTF